MGAIVNYSMKKFSVFFPNFKERFFFQNLLRLKVTCEVKTSVKILGYSLWDKIAKILIILLKKVLNISSFVPQGPEFKTQCAIKGANSSSMFMGIYLITQLFLHHEVQNKFQLYQNVSAVKHFLNFTSLTALLLQRLQNREVRIG